MIMNELKSVNPFTNEETVKISHAKNRLEEIIKNTGVFESHTYNIKAQKLIKSSIPDDDKLEIVIAGGVISSIMLGEQLNDVDVFILNMEIDVFQDLINEKTGPWLVKYFFDEENDPRSDDYKNEHVFATATNELMKVQYILTDYKDRKSLLADFDYLHCTASYHNGKLFINRETYDSIEKKMLVRQHKNKKVKPHREQKFVQRGWSTEIDAMFNQPSKTLKEILQNKLDNVRGNTPVDAWNEAALNTSWNDTIDELEELLHSK